MTHVFVVDQRTFKYHLEYLFAGTGASDKLSPFILTPDTYCHPSTERMLVGMIADISRIRIGDKIVFYVQTTKKSPGSFFGVFKVASDAFFDENDESNYLKGDIGKGLSFRVLLEPDEVYAKGITEHEYLDSLQGKTHPYDLCWSLIYRKLKGNRGCTMIMDYEFDDLLAKLKDKNDNTTLTPNHFTFDSERFEIKVCDNEYLYEGRKDSLNILLRLKYKFSRKNAFETHLQAYITQNFDKEPLKHLLAMLPDQSCWIGNEVSCGVGMQRIDVMLKQETENDVYFRIIELKDEKPHLNILSQIKWYLEWLSYYVLPKYEGKNIHVVPTVIANGNLNDSLQTDYQLFSFNIEGAEVCPLQYIGFEESGTGIDFIKYL